MRNNQKGFTALEIILLVIVVGLVCGAIGFVVSNVTNKKDDNASTQAKASDNSNSDKTASSTTADKKQLPELVKYPDPGVTILSEADVSKLTDASDSFKSFIKNEITTSKSQDSPGQGCDEPTYVRVNLIYKDTFASGGAGACGGAAAMWKKQDNTWTHIWGGQQGIQCSTVTQYSIPHQVVEECLNDTTFEPQKNTL